MTKYLILGDGKNPHILKWIKTLRSLNQFNIYLISFNKVSQLIKNLMDNKNIFEFNMQVNPKGGNYKLLFLIPKIRSIIYKIQPDIINAHYLSSYGFIAALLKPSKTTLIQSTWGTDILVQPFQNFFRFKLANFALQKADLITADSYTMADIIINKFNIPSEKVLVFPFGLENIEFYSGKKENIVFSNRALKANYNIDKIIKWFANQPQTYKLIIANDGYLKTSLKNLVQKLNLENRVEFVGFLSKEENIKWYKKSKYFISIPTSDSTSVSLLEAMAYGCIPIVSNIPANREWILDGINGIFFHEKLNLEKINIYANFYEINFKLIKEKALFSQNISQLLMRISNRIASH